MRVIAKIRGIKGYKGMSEERLISSINESESMKESEKDFDNTRIEEIKKDFNKLKDRLSKPKRKEIRKYLYRIENEKTKETEQNRLKLEKNLSKLYKVLKLWWYWIQGNRRCKKFIRFINWWRLL